jgi:branched-chain amino acid transport system substrate-binding protein
LQATSFKNQLGPLLNGIVNYETWVPSPKALTPSVQKFLAEYQSRAAAEGVDPLGYYLATWGYAYLEVLADAVTGTKSLNDDKIAEYLHSHSMPTIMGDITYNKDGEFTQSRMMQVQYHDIKPGAGLDVWRGMSYQTVLTPEDLKTGNVIWPYAKAKTTT